MTRISDAMFVSRIWTKRSMIEQTASGRLSPRIHILRSGFLFLELLIGDVLYCSVAVIGLGWSDPEPQADCEIWKPL